MLNSERRRRRSYNWFARILCHPNHSIFLKQFRIVFVSLKLVCDLIKPLKTRTSSASTRESCDVRQIIAVKTAMKTMKSSNKYLVLPVAKRYVLSTPFLPFAHPDNQQTQTKQHYPLNVRRTMRSTVAHRFHRHPRLKDKLACQAGLCTT